ncbi:hypothetical protein PV08_07258 [Exophiala spinifera]|uniref:Shikimate dehydrogenase substrate binding N-terminal domain-containing protein n=1 Tax=Exophiala spinifera TaxID=91928 RepID=A0A0D2BTB2_9EURO|nr:uncharacterized protein PV08_07258 [Exophiala spinifera]KIW14474.1 hypothetical protein PV08_07258 [Exophiala spinifera]
MAQHSSKHNVYIAGGPGGDSIGPAIHNYIAGSLGLDWTCEFLRLSDVNDVMTLFRRDDFAGGIVTMPHKRTIIPLLDSVDDFAQDIGACNVVVRTPSGKLHGTNTDWLGIRNAVNATEKNENSGQHTAVVYGAGGASRGAVYALAAGLGCSTIYIINRDDNEVAALMADVEAYRHFSRPRLVHVTSLEQAETLQCPRYIICTVPDFEPTSPTEVACRDILGQFLQRGRQQQNILLDMCYHPPVTRNIKAAMEASWTVIPGFLVSGHQFARQWELWAGRHIDSHTVLTMCNDLVRERESSKVVAAA